MVWFLDIRFKKIKIRKIQESTLFTFSNKITLRLFKIVRKELPINKKINLSFTQVLIRTIN